MPEDGRRIARIDERGIVEFEAFHGVAQFGEIVGAEGVDRAEDDGFDVFESGEHFGGAAFFEGNRIADAGFGDDFHARDNVADFAGVELLARDLFELHFAEFFDFIRCAGRHHADAVAGFDFAVEEAHVDDDTAIGIVEGVEDEGLERFCAVSAWGGNAFGDGFEDVFDACARFGARVECFERIEP